MNILNMFRLALFAAVAILSPTAVAQAQGQANTDQAHAADISVEAWIACFDEEPGLTADEPRQILKLASATWSTKCEVIRQVLANEDFVERIRVHAGWMTHAAIGLDPTGELSNDLRQNILGPVIRSPESSTEAVTIAFEVLRCLRPDHSTDRLLLSEWLKDDNHQIAELRDILESYAVQLRGTDAAALATLLVEHIVANPEQNQRAASGVLDTLAGVLQAEDVKPLVKLLVAHVQEEDHRDALESLRSTLGSLATTMDRSDAALVASMSLEQMRTEQDSLTLGDHAILLRRLAASLDVTDTRAVARVLVERLESLTDIYAVSQLTATLEELAMKLDPGEVQSIVDTMVQVVENGRGDSPLDILHFPREILLGSIAKLAVHLEPASQSAIVAWTMNEFQSGVFVQIGELYKAVGSLSRVLKPEDRLRQAQAIVERIVTQRSAEGAYQINELLAQLIEGLDPSDVRTLSARVEARILGGEVSPENLVSLCETLGTMANLLDADELLPVVSFLIDDTIPEAEPYYRDRLMEMMEPIARRLPGDQSRPFVSRFVQRMATEEDPEMLADLGRLVAMMSKELDDAEIQPAISALAQRIVVEQMDARLETLVDAFEALAARWDSAADHQFARDLLSRLQNEREGRDLVLLAKLLGSRLDQLPPEDRDDACRIVVEWFDKLRNVDTLTLFADELGQAPCRRASQRREAADRLLKGLAVATVFEPIYFEEGERDLIPGLKSIVAEAELQSLVDTLKAPLFADGVAGEVILQVIEEKTGASFDGDLWRFVEWATTDPQGISLNLDLAGPGPWSILDEPAKVKFPSLERFSFQPQGTLEMQGSVLSFVVVGDIAYLPAGTSGLRLVDVSDPMHPRELGHAEAGPYALATCVAGNFAYVAAGPAGWPEAHLHVVDVSNVTAPKVVGSIDLPDYPSDVAVRNGRVFVADHTAGMRVIDVSNPRQPQEVGALNTPGYIVDVALAGDYALLADREVGLRAVDISAPDDPKEVSLINTAGPCFDICVSGGRAYLATGEVGLVVVDISDPRSLKELATIPTEFAVSVSAQENLVVVGSGALGCRVFDLADLSLPAVLDLKMSANGAASFCRDNTCFISDVSFDALPYGTGNQTILRIYRVSGPGDAEPTAEQPTQTLQNTQPAPRVTPVKETLAAAGKAWGPVVNVSEDEGVSLVPVIATDGAGNVHLAWMSESQGRFEIFYSRRTADGGFSRPVNVSNSELHSFFPSLAIDKSGKVNLVWMEGAEESFDIYSSLGDGATWSRPINVSNNPGISQRPKVVVDSAGIAHAIWYDNTGGSFQLWHAQYKDEKWSPAVNTKLVNWYLTHDPNFNLGPGLTADSRGNIHVLWYDIDVATQHLFYSRWDGEAWSDRQKASGPRQRRTSEATIAVDPSDQLHAAWFDSGSVWYSHSTENGWSEAVRVGEESELPAIAVDSGGVVHLAWTQSRQIFYGKGGGEWLEVVNISESPGTCAVPAITTDRAGNVHVAWMDDRPGNFDIVYRRWQAMASPAEESSEGKLRTE